MGFCYFYKWENVDTTTCSKCEYFSTGTNGYKYFCEARDAGSNEIEESVHSSNKCSEFELTTSVKDEVAEKSKGKGIFGKLAEKAGGEVKKAVMRDINKLGKDLGSML